MPTLRPAPRVLVALALAAAGCSPDHVTDPPPGPAALPDGLAARAVAIRVDVRAGTATVLDRPQAEAARSGAAFALLGANEIGAATSANVFRSTWASSSPRRCASASNSP
jgi:hypothetical protein